MRRESIFFGDPSRGTEISMAPCVYDSTELAYFDRLLEEAVAEARGRGLVPARPADATELRTRMAAAIFVCAAAGERDPERIRSYVVTAAIDRHTLHLLSAAGRLPPTARPRAREVSKP
jgi:hypothetical protein